MNKKTKISLLVAIAGLAGLLAISFGILAALGASPLNASKQPSCDDKIWQLNFKYNVPTDKYVAAVSPLANQFAAVPGLRSKVWIMNAETSEAGGIYLFDNQASLDAFLKSDLFHAVASHPALSDFSTKQFDVLPGPTKITRGPVSKACGGR